MSLEKIKKSALARLRSPTGYLSATMPETLVYDNNRIDLWEVLKKDEAGELSEAEETNLINILRASIKDIENHIEQTEVEEEVNTLLSKGLGTKRVLSILEKKRDRGSISHNKLEDAKRWLGFSNNLK